MQKKQNKILLGFVVVAIALSVSLSIPVAVQAGEELLHSWDTQIEATKRFEVLADFNSAAVLDKETGLVWEQSPSTGTFSWFLALSHCYTLEVDGRMGWRLPTVEELASLVDPSVPSPGPTLPSGHPFSNVSTTYWSATTYAPSTISAWLVAFYDGDVVIDEKDNPFLAWCVRGGQGYDGQ